MTATPLTRAERSLVRLAATLGAGDARAAAPELADALETAARDASDTEVEEVLIQSYLFLGYPTALNAFALWRRISGAEPPPAADDGWEGWAERGREVCRRVYGGQYERLRENVSRLHPDMERWMVAEGYGKVLGRPGLELRVRELCIAALLAVVCAPTQLYSHLRGALNVGASTTQVEEALEVAAELAEPRAGALARETWERVRSRSRSGPPGAGSGV